jgi:hypothetical protein
LKVGACSRFKPGIAKTVEKKVAGKKNMVMKAIVFIEELSRLAASASLMLAAVSSLVMRLKIYAEA